MKLIEAGTDKLNTRSLGTELMSFLKDWSIFTEVINPLIP